MFCIQCNKALKGNFKRCFKCRVKNNEASIRTRSRRDKHGLCKICGNPREEKFIKSCSKCRIFRNSKKQKNIQEAKINNLCYRCFKSKSLNSFCNKCETCYFKETARSNGFKSTDWIILKELLINQNYKCYYTNDVLIIGINTSLEHKNPKSRFPEEINDINNIVWCCLDVNLSKRNKTEEEFILMCNKVTNKFGKK